MTQEPDEALLWAREDEAAHRRVNPRICISPTETQAHARGYRVGYRAGQAAAEARIKELEAALEWAKKPEWFYSDEEGSPFHCPDEAIDDYIDRAYGLMPAEGEVFSINTATPCADIWVAARIFTKEECEARDDGKWYEFTEHASREEAETALKGGDA